LPCVSGHCHFFCIIFRLHCIILPCLSGHYHLLAIALTLLVSGLLLSCLAVTVLSCLDFYMYSFLPFPYFLELTSPLPPYPSPCLALPWLVWYYFVF
jgi:hypothetical protein